MPEATTAIDYVMEKASGPHFSGLRLSPSTTSSPRASASGSPPSASFFVDSDLPNQPFVIGKFCIISPNFLHFLAQFLLHFFPFRVQL